VRIFSSLYDRALEWAAHPHAHGYLAGLSFAESSFFPVPPDVMLAPMVLARPDRGWHLAALTTVTSVLGGLFGYFIGAVLFAQIGQPLIEFYHAGDEFRLVEQWFERFGVWVVFLAGFSPIPYKLFTITSGVLGMSLLPFVLASLIGRGARFFLVAGLIMWGGERFSKFLKQWIDHIGWAMVVIIAVAVVLLRA
jgi:membrane protein YqaA with SNARE-associated domain